MYLTLRFHLSCSGNLWAYQVTQSGSEAVAGCGREVQIWNVVDGVLQKGISIGGTEGLPHSLCLVDSDRSVATLLDSGIAVFDRQSGTKIAHAALPGLADGTPHCPPLTLFACHGERFLVTSLGNRISVLEYPNLHVRNTRIVPGLDFLEAVPDSNFLILASRESLGGTNDRVVSLLRIPSLELSRRVTSLEGRQFIGLSSSASGRFLAFCSKGNEVQVWDTSTCCVVHVLAIQKGMSHWTGLSSDGRLLAVGSQGPSSLTVWELAGKAKRTPAHRATSVSADGTGRGTTAKPRFLLRDTHVSTTSWAGNEICIWKLEA